MLQMATHGFSSCVAFGGPEPAALPCALIPPVFPPQASLLCKATYEGKLDRLKLLLKAGCNPDAHDYGACGPVSLLLAAKMFHVPQPAHAYARIPCRCLLVSHNPGCCCCSFSVRACRWPDGAARGGSRGQPGSGKSPLSSTRRISMCCGVSGGARIQAQLKQLQAPADSGFMLYP
jgi:hypothetical protein